MKNKRMMFKKEKKWYKRLTQTKKELFWGLIRLGIIAIIFYGAVSA